VAGLGTRRRFITPEIRHKCFSRRDIVIAMLSSPACVWFLSSDGKSTRNTDGIHRTIRFWVEKTRVKTATSNGVNTGSEGHSESLVVRAPTSIEASNPKVQGKYWPIEQNLLNETR